MSRKINIDLCQAEAVYRETASLKTTAAILGVKSDTLRSHFWRAGIAVNSRGYRKYSLNELYFDHIDSEDRAYWLGFIYADGNVVANRKESKLTVNLALKDRDRLVELVACLGANNPIVDRLATRNGKEHPYSSLVICSKRLVRSLIEKGCVPAKSHILTFPRWIRPHLVVHFIRGYFDGDGCICRSATGDLRFRLLGTEEMLTAIQHVLVERCAVGKTQIKKVKNVHCLAYHGKKSVARIGDFFYTNANYFMARKRNKWEGLL